MLDQLLCYAVQQNASDIHLSPGSRIRLRILGELTCCQDFKIYSASDIKNMLYPYLNHDQHALFDSGGEIDFAITINQERRFRINLFQHELGFAAVIRIIPNELPELSSFMLPAAFINKLEEKNGLILLTGKAGSGKTTTLNSMLHYINQHQQKHIITLEDPIEFKHTHIQSLITQREIYKHTKNFESALHTALRQDPDIIVIGEMRNEKTIRLALRAAVTGHLILSTMHTHSATHGLTRIIDMFKASEKSVIRMQLADTLAAIACQRLITKQQHREPIFEILMASSAVKNLIRENKIMQIQNVMQTSANLGMRTFSEY